MVKNIQGFMELDINRRREYLKTCAQVETAMGQLPLILPDYMLVFAVAVLTHDPNFKKYDDVTQLKQIEKCLWLILEPLISNKEYFCFGFYKNLIDRIKLHKDAINPFDDDTNFVRFNLTLKLSANWWIIIWFFSIVFQKMWAICDIAMHLIYTKSTNYDTRDFPLDARIPEMYFQPQDDEFENSALYIPADMYTATTNSKKMGIVLPVSSVFLFL